MFVNRRTLPEPYQVGSKSLSETSIKRMKKRNDTSLMCDALSINYATGGARNESICLEIAHGESSANLEVIN